jgi:hypothetical protein
MAAAAAGVPERGPPGAVALPAEDAVGEARVEPGAAPGAHRAHGAGHAVRRVERLGRLGEQRDLGEARDRVAAQPLGVAAAVPVLVERADGVGRGVGEADAAGDLGAAVAAHGDERAGDVGRAGDAEEVVDPLAQRAPDPDGAHEAQGDARAALPVDLLHQRLDDAVVRAEQGGEARGVARAAGVLEEDGVVQRRAVVVAEAELLGEPAGHEAAPQRVALGLARAQVERVRQGGEDVAQRDERGGGGGHARGAGDWGEYRHDPAGCRQRGPAGRGGGRDTGAAGRPYAGLRFACGALLPPPALAIAAMLVVLLAAVLLGCLALIPLGLPGLWLMLAAALGYNALVPGRIRSAG